MVGFNIWVVNNNVVWLQCLRYKYTNKNINENFKAGKTVGEDINARRKIWVSKAKSVLQRVSAKIGVLQDLEEVKTYDETCPRLYLKPHRNCYIWIYYNRIMQRTVKLEGDDAIREYIQKRFPDTCTLCLGRPSKIKTCKKCHGTGARDHICNILNVNRCGWIE